MIFVRRIRLLRTLNTETCPTIREYLAIEYFHYDRTIIPYHIHSVFFPYIISNRATIPYQHVFLPTYHVTYHHTIPPTYHITSRIFCIYIVYQTEPSYHAHVVYRTVSSYHANIHKTYPTHQVEALAEVIVVVRTTPHRVSCVWSFQS